jgi:hypothetical protein
MIGEIANRGGAAAPACVTVAFTRPEGWIKCPFACALAHAHPKAPMTSTAVSRARRLMPVRQCGTPFE